jgi:hypothetical protein
LLWKKMTDAEVPDAEGAEKDKDGREDVETN